MANVNVTIRVDSDLKKQADELFDELGMSFTTAVNVFVRQAVREGRIPFLIGRPEQSEQTRYSVVDVEGSQEH